MKAVWAEVEDVIGAGGGEGLRVGGCSEGQE